LLRRSEDLKLTSFFISNVCASSSIVAADGSTIVGCSVSISSANSNCEWYFPPAPLACIQAFQSWENSRSSVTRWSPQPVASLPGELSSAVTAGRRWSAYTSAVGAPCRSTYAVHDARSRTWTWPVVRFGASASCSAWARASRSVLVSTISW
jgi:hypothetical protein